MKENEAEAGARDPSVPEWPNGNLEPRQLPVESRRRLEGLVSSLSHELQSLDTDHQDRALGMALQRLAETIDADRAWLCRYDGHGNAPLMLEWAADPSTAPLIDDPGGNGAVDPWSRPDPRTGRLFKLDSSSGETDPLHAALWRMNMQGLLEIPMFCGDRALGHLAFATSQPPDPWDDDIVALLGFAADVLATALDRFVGAVPTHYDPVGPDLASAPGLGFDAQVRRLLEVGRERFGLEIAVLSRIEDQNYRVVQVVAPSRVRIRAGTSFDLRALHCRDVVERSRPLGFASAEGCGWERHPDHRRQAYLGTRILVDGEIWGTLSFSSMKPRDEPIEAAEFDSLQLMAQWIGKELETTRCREALDLARVSLELSSENAFWVDPSGRFSLANEAARRMLGYSREELARLSLPEVDGTHGREDWPELWVRVKRSGRVVLHSRWCNKAGSELPVEIVANYVQVGQTEHVLAFVRDLSEDDGLQHTLRESEKAITKAVFALPSAIMLTRLEDGNIIEANESASTMVGYSRKEMIGRTTHELGLWVDPDERRKMAELVERLGSVHNRVCQLRSRSGEERQVMLSAQPVEVRGEPCMLVSAEDVTERLSTERKRDHLEKMLRQSQKMESLGQLAGGVAHDFNNVLTAILCNSEMLLSEASARGSEQTALEQIHQAGERAAALTRQLLAFSRKQARELEVLDLNGVVTNTESMLHRLIGEHIRLETALDPRICKIMADVGQLEQVILNLVLNARDAMPEGGTLRIETRNLVLDEEQVARWVDARPGPHVLLTVTDSGHGISGESLQHVFEPFFTTKPVGQGTGLGLATVYGVVKQSGGHITVQSELGQGTTFSVYLPATDAAFALPAERPPEVTSTNDETVLVCEDEWMVRDLVCKILESRGYRVLSAGHGRRALELAAEHDGRIDLLLTDMVMPEVSGVELARELAQQRPDLRVLFMSGYTSDVLSNHGMDERRTELIEKPFSAQGLLQRIRSVLSEAD